MSERNDLTPRKGDDFTVLRRVRMQIARIDAQLAAHRKERDEIALRLVERGHSWREVAEVAGFESPYISTLRKRAARGG